MDSNQMILAIPPKTNMGVKKFDANPLSDIWIFVG